MIHMNQKVHVACNWMTGYPLTGVVRVTFFNVDPNHIFGVSETRHFKGHVLIDTEVY